MQVDPVFPRSRIGVTHGVRSTMFLCIAVAFDPFVKLPTVFFSLEVHLLQFVFSRDIKQWVSTPAVTVVVDIDRFLFLGIVVRFVHRQTVTLSHVAVIDKRDGSCHEAFGIAGSPITDRNHHTVRDIEHGIIIFPIGISHRRGSVIHRFGMPERIRRSQVQTEIETLFKQGGQRIGISHIRIFQIGNTEILLVYGVIRSGGSFHTRNGIDFGIAR